jgi:hypothetical protein
MEALILVCNKQLPCSEIEMAGWQEPTDQYVTVTVTLDTEFRQDEFLVYLLEQKTAQDEFNRAWKQKQEAKNET